MSGVWNRVLDALEAGLAETEAALETGTPPRDQPAEPLPAELAPRAQSLLDRTQQLEAQAAENLERLRASLRDLPGRRPATLRSRTGRVVDIDA